ncbi:MAG: L-threonylcarbamoyladenylate synthase [Gammaproteobacteria bacterium]
MRAEIHLTHPQPRLITMACDTLRDDGVIVYPTDSCYGFGCALGSQSAVQRIRAIRRMSKQHFLTLICRDLSELSSFARVDKAGYRLIKSLTPGPYTFILQATHGVPRRLQEPKRKTIGLRIPDSAISNALVRTLETPMLSTTVEDAYTGAVLSDPHDIDGGFGTRIDMLLDGGEGGVVPTTVIDLSSGDPVLVRPGLGKVDHLLNPDRS